MVAYVHVCIAAYTHIRTLNIYLYIYTKLSMCGVQRVRGAEAARTCCVKCRCCSLKKKKRKNTETPWLLLNREQRDFGTHRSATITERKRERQRKRAQSRIHSHKETKRKEKRREKRNGDLITRDPVFESIRANGKKNEIEKLSRETHREAPLTDLRHSRCRQIA